jgi:hypothetical protein
VIVRPCAVDHPRNHPLVATWRARSDLYETLERWNAALNDADQAVAKLKAKNATLDQGHAVRYQLVRILSRAAEAGAIDKLDDYLTRWELAFGMGDIEAGYLLAEYYGRRPTEDLARTLEQLKKIAYRACPTRARTRPASSKSLSISSNTRLAKPATPLALRHASTAIACGSKNTPPPPHGPVGNRAAPHAAAPDDPCELRDQIIDAATHELLIGATVVLEGAKHTTEKIGITDATGRFAFTDLRST